ncbi:hypothetical protein V2O64_20930 [Verrucomicrobiaceae bacterium 227]
MPHSNASPALLFFRALPAALMALGVAGLSSCSPASQPPVSSQPTSAPVIYKPRVTIHNDSYKNIVLGLRGPETRFVSIPARESRSVELLSGNYKYAATARNTNTISGYKFFGSDRSYNWNVSVD